IAQTIYDHYKPVSAEDSVPRTVEGAVLSIADKAETIAGMFALGLQPTGSKDPFALRRQANGIVKTIAERKLPISISNLFELARLRVHFGGVQANQEYPSPGERNRESHCVNCRLRPIRRRSRANPRRPDSGNRPSSGAFQAGAGIFSRFGGNFPHPSRSGRVF